MSNSLSYHLRYHIQPFTVEEELAYGPYGIKLMPYENNKRCWWLRADSEEERMEWEAVSMLFI
jgi:hypothetical protein